jgi:hypothetical protein
MMNHGSFSVEIILDHPGNSGWILEKIAQKISSELRKKGCIVSIKESPEFDTDVTFWIQYTDKTLKESIKSKPRNVWSALVTHVDESSKLMRVNILHRAGVNLIFMSDDHSKSVSKKINATTTLPSIRIGSDLAQVALEYKVGIVSKCHPDGRKNEDWLISFSKKELFNNVVLTIIGTGWGATVKKLRKQGVKVNLYDGIENVYPPYPKIIEIQSTFDLFLYFGFDEGSLGALDAYLLNTDLLVTKQGFHLDFEIEEDSFCSDLLDAQRKFALKKDSFFNLRSNRNDWTWEGTAIALLGCWEEFTDYKESGTTAKSRKNLYLFFSRENLSMLPKSIYRLLFIRVPRKIYSLSRQA